MDRVSSIGPMMKEMTSEYGDSIVDRGLHLFTVAGWLVLS